MSDIKNVRIEEDLLGTKEVSNDLYYGVHTLRAVENFKISTQKISDVPEFVRGMVLTKKAAALANGELGTIRPEIADKIIEACDLMLNTGKCFDQFPVDVYQGGAGTSVNMNTNEVLANIALELMGLEKGRYDVINPNDHVNKCQSTNDAYPTGFRVAVVNSTDTTLHALEALIAAFDAKAAEFKSILKMGRTQLQDAVPMTLGQEFHAFAVTLREEIKSIKRCQELLLEVNLGATAIGTGLNAVPGFAKLCAANLSKLTGENFVSASDLVEATPDTGAYVSYSSALKRLAIKLSKICNDLRLMASGPRCGLNEINLPPKAPGSSIMPGKVNPVIPEVTNQVCFKVIGNDTTISFAAEAGQLELNVMEPIITESLFESLTWMKNAIETLTSECILGITVNKERCYEMVKNSIGIVTALNPIIGYKKSTKVAKEAHATGRSVYDIVIEQGILSKEELDKALDPKEMLQSHKFTLK
mgnify:CR=1 FL=1